MKKQVIYFLGTIFFLVIWINTSFAQGPGEPFHPMTANGAKGVAKSGHILVWENPSETVYNEIYFSSNSSLVASLDTSARIVNGYPSSTLNSIDLTMLGDLNNYTKYYWRVVEHDSTYFTAGPIWYFISRIDPTWQTILFDFSNGTENWIITNDGGKCVWEIHDASEYTLPATATGNVMAADADACGSGTSTLSTATTTGIDASESMDVFLEFDNDWNAISSYDSAMVDVSTDGGTTWQNVLTFDGTDVRDTHEEWDLTGLVSFSTFDLRFVSIQPGWDWWWAIDNVLINLFGPLTPILPPNYLAVFADTTEQRVLINWDPGYSPGQINGYRLQRKDGLPDDSTIYVTIIETDANTFTYSDYNVQLNQDYTYRIQTLSGPPPWGSIWGNEATAYVPEVIPVELMSFTVSLTGNDVHLNWVTATELNNYGFGIFKTSLGPPFTKEEKQAGWVKIGFVPGHGTTTEPQYYTFTDESLQQGRYQYRLKQIDYDGTFEYSNIVEVEVGLPNDFKLEQNYPNPFNPSTKIKFTIAKSPLPGGDGRGGLQHVKLVVYDVLGNEVATLVNEEKPAGEYEVEFNAKGLPSGIYFYRLIAGSYSSTKKMILLR